MIPSRIVVGVVGAPHGVRGEARVKPFTADPLALASYGPLRLEDGRELAVQSARVQKDMLVVRFRGVGTRDAAAALTNLKLFIDRDRLPPVEDDEEFYQADLVGLTAVDAGGIQLGSVVAVPDFGAGDLLEIAPAAGGPTVYVPFTKAFVPVVDIAGGCVVVEGWEAITAPEEPEPGEDGER